MKLIHAKQYHQIHANPDEIVVVLNPDEIVVLKKSLQKCLASCCVGLLSTVLELT